MRAFGIHFFVSAGQWIFHETVRKKVENYEFRSALEPPTTSSANLKKAREKKKGEKEKSSGNERKKIKLFLNKNGKFTSFLTSGANHEVSSRKTHLLFAIALQDFLFSGRNDDESLTGNEELGRKFKLTSICRFKSSTN